MYKTMETLRSDNSIFYRVACACCDKNHDLIIEIEKDEIPSIGLHFYYDAESTIHWNNYNFFQRQWKKLCLGLKLILTGCISLEGYFLIIEEKHVNDFIQALEEGKKYLKKEN